MYIETQFSIFMVNKPGVLAQVLGEKLVQVEATPERIRKVDDAEVANLTHSSTLRHLAIFKIARKRENEPAHLLTVNLVHAAKRK